MIVCDGFGTLIVVESSNATRRITRTCRLKPLGRNGEGERRTDDEGGRLRGGCSERRALRVGQGRGGGAFKRGDSEPRRGPSARCGAPERETFARDRARSSVFRLDGETDGVHQEALSMRPAVAAEETQGN